LARNTQRRSLRATLLDESKELVVVHARTLPHVQRSEKGAGRTNVPEERLLMSKILALYTYEIAIPGLRTPPERITR
jgi:hypothetical protein